MYIYYKHYRGGAAKEFNEQDEIERLGIICTDVESTVLNIYTYMQI